MKSEVLIVKEIKLTLSTEEAYWLKSYMQNNLDEAETLESRELRANLFNALPAFNYLQDEY